MADQLPKTMTMISQCEGRAAGDPLTFGDGKTQFYTEARCQAQILTMDGQILCKDCRLFGHGSITDPFPPNSKIFGPTVWFLETWKRCGAPSREALKKAVEAHNKVAAMARPKKPTVSEQLSPQKKPVEPVSNIKYFQTDQTIQLADIKENHQLKTTKSKNIYKEPLTGLLFERTAAGHLIPVLQAS